MRPPKIRERRHALADDHAAADLRDKADALRALERTTNAGSTSCSAMPYIRTARGRPASRRIPPPPECLPRVTTLAVGGAAMIFGRRNRFGHSREQVVAEAKARQMAGDAVMGLRRWTLNHAVAWIATRSPEAVSQNGSGTRLAAWVALFPGQYPIQRYDDAWRELAAEMANGTVSAISAEIQRDRVEGSILERPGVRFPPSEQPGLGLACFVENEPPRTVVRPKRWKFAARWTEYADLSFERTAVMAAFPTIGLQSDQDGSVQAALPHEGTCMTHVPSEPLYRAGTHDARVRQLIAEEFPNGIGDVKNATIRRAINPRFGEEDGDIAPWTIARAIRAIRAEEATGKTKRTK